MKCIQHPDYRYDTAKRELLLGCIKQHLIFRDADGRARYYPETFSGFPPLSNTLVTLLHALSNPPPLLKKQNQVDVQAVTFASKDMRYLSSSLAMRLEKPFFDPAWQRLEGMNGSLDGIFEPPDGYGNLFTERKSGIVVVTNVLRYDSGMKEVLRIAAERKLEVIKIIGLIPGNPGFNQESLPLATVFAEGELDASITEYNHSSAGPA